MTLLDDEINRAYKLKELYRAFDRITKEEINDYDMEKELDSIYKCQSKNVQICSLKNVQFYN